MQPGSIVRCRHREWVVLPTDSEEEVVLRPLTGTPEDAIHLHRQLMNLVGGTLPSERLEPASFPLPRADRVADAAAAHLLWQAARLILREGATPFRSLGCISIRPRTLLAEGGYRLPDDAQKALADPRCVADFFYFYDPNICIFCDGAVHDDPAQAAQDRQLRSQLLGHGYRVIALRYDQDLREQLARYPEVFGKGN